MRRRRVIPKVVAGIFALLAATGPLAEATGVARSPTRVTFLVAALPGGDAAALVRATGASVVRPAGPVVLAVGRDPDLALRLWQASAWALTADARLVALVD
jgi:hypothetical protein